MGIESQSRSCKIGHFWHWFEQEARRGGQAFPPVRRQFAPRPSTPTSLEAQRPCSRPGGLGSTPASRARRSGPPLQP